MRSNTKGLAKGMAEMGKVGEPEIQCCLRNAAYLAALDGFAAGIQALFPDLRNWGFLVAGESTRDGSGGHMVRLSDEFDRQVRVGQIPADVIHDPSIKIQLFMGCLQVLKFQADDQKVEQRTGIPTRDSPILQD